MKELKNVSFSVTKRYVGYTIYQVNFVQGGGNGKHWLKWHFFQEKKILMSPFMLQKIVSMTLFIDRSAWNLFLTEEFMWFHFNLGLWWKICLTRL